MKLRVGIISASWGTFAHLPAWRAVPGIEVVAVCTSRRETAEQAAVRCGIARPFWNAHEMAADPGIDIIDCGTRPNIREAMVLTGLAHGKHIYNAIPFATGLDGARRIHTAWRQAGTIGVVDAFSEWVPAHRFTKELIDDGYLGRPFGGTCIFNMSLFNILNPQFPYNWFAQEGLGVSAVRNLGSHALHMLSFLFGDIAELVSYDGQLLDEWRAPDGTSIKAETNDSASVLLRFNNGMVIQCQVSWNATLGSGWTLDLFGANGRIVVRAPSFPTSRDTILQAGKLGDAAPRCIEIPQRFLQASDIAIDAGAEIQATHPMALSMHAMANAIRGEGQARPDFAQAWKVERALEAVRQSVATRRWVCLDEIA
jgi:predicted dehydrogenase